MNTDVNIDIDIDIDRDTNTHTRYSNGSEFNNSLAARHGTLLQRVRYLLSKKQILVTTFMYGANGLVQVMQLWGCDLLAAYLRVCLINCFASQLADVITDFYGYRLAVPM